MLHAAKPDAASLPLLALTMRGMTCRLVCVAVVGCTRTAVSCPQSSLLSVRVLCDESMSDANHLGSQQHKVPLLCPSVVAAMWIFKWHSP